MNNKETLDIFGQLLNGNKNMIIGKEKSLIDIIVLKIEKKP